MTQNRQTAGLRLLPAAWLLAAASASAATPLSYLDKPDGWFRSDDGQRVLDNVLSQQWPAGGWWKAYDPE